MALADQLPPERLAVGSDTARYASFSPPRSYHQYCNGSQQMRLDIHAPLIYQGPSSQRKRSHDAVMDAEQEAIHYSNPHHASPRSIGWQGATQYNTPFAFQSQAISTNESLAAFGWQNEVVRTPSSRSPSYVSQDSVLSEPVERMCPLITGDADRCDPSKCGPDAPCLKFEELPVIEDCTSVPCLMQSSQTNPVELDFTNPFHTRTTSNTSKRQALNGSRSTPQSTQRQASAFRPPSSSYTFALKPSSTPSTTKHRSKAAQAHSLVEKKYRENLNAKMAHLHELLQNSYFTLPDDTDSTTATAARTKQNPHLSLSNRTFIASDEVRSEATYKKGQVLDDALMYVQRAETELSHMSTEIERLQQLVRELEDDKAAALQRSLLPETTNRSPQQQKLSPQTQAQSMAQAQALLKKMNRGGGLRDYSDCTLMHQMRGIGLRVGVS